MAVFSRLTAEGGELEQVGGTWKVFQSVAGWNAWLAAQSQTSSKRYMDTKPAYPVPRRTT